MSDHTPGPWKWDGHLEQAIITADSGEEVLWGCGCCDSPRLLCEADARLIAAAPELLEALENLLKVHEGEGGTQCHAGDIARAAIAKAKGESEQ